MNELKERLLKVEDSYYDFVSAILYYAENKDSRCKAIIDFLDNNPNALSADIVKFVSLQDDFYEDAAFMNAV